MLNGGGGGRSSADNGRFVKTKIRREISSTSAGSLLLYSLVACAYLSECPYGGNNNCFLRAVKGTDGHIHISSYVRADEQSILHCLRVQVTTTQPRVYLGIIITREIELYMAWRHICTLSLTYFSYRNSPIFRVTGY